MLRIEELLKSEIISNEDINNIFSSLENLLSARKEVFLDFGKVNFISVYFLEKLEQAINRAKGLNIKIQISNVQPTVYKVFQVARAKSILDIIL